MCVIFKIGLLYLVSDILVPLLTNLYVNYFKNIISDLDILVATKHYL